MTFSFGKVTFNNINFYYYIVDLEGHIRVVQQKTDRMMRQILHFGITVILCVFSFFPGCRISAQVVSMPSASDTANNPVWARMMMDPDANFFSTVSAYEKYRKNRPGTGGYGWSLFKRWEYLMRGRVAADGTFPAPDAVFNAWNSFKQTSRSPVGNWVSLGPSTAPAYGTATGYLGIGRLNVVAFHPSDQNKIYAGTPSGGLWLTPDNGATWSCTTDNLPTLGVSAIAVDFSNPDDILLGTGDRDHGDAPGMGVFKSHDGGATWAASKTGMGNVTVCKLIQHPGNALIFLAATTNGIFRSADGGEIWALVKAGNCMDVCYKPGNPDIVYATFYGNFFRSTDNGLSFTQITSGLIGGSLATNERGAIAVSAANANYVYFIQTNSDGGFQGVYRSANSGESFTTRSSSPNILDRSCLGDGTGGQGGYNLAIVADPANAEIVYVGGVNVWKSTNGGQNWAINSHWNGECSVPAVHSDCHFLGFSPLNSRLYAGNDGGIFYTANGGASWIDCTAGMAIGQIYKIGQSQTDPSKTICGLQDNGTQINTSTGWVAVGGGDGMECAIDYQNASYTYHSKLSGSIFRKVDNANEAQIAGSGLYGIDADESGAWVTPFILSENDPKKMFVGFNNVWRCSDVKAATLVWTKISSESTICSVLEQSPANPNILYVVRDNKLRRTGNANATTPSWFTNCTLPGGLTPTDLEAHPTDSLIVYATAGSKVYKSINKGVSWNLVPGVLPDIPVNTIVYDKNTSEGLYIGTQTGVLFKNSTMSNWVVFSANLPAVDVRELEIYYSSNPLNNKIMAATYGRGLWKSDIYSATTDPPAANFTLNPVVPCQGQTVQLTDLSTNVPTSWAWSFSPASVTFLGSTTSSSQNPQVKFNATADYSITLIASNSNGSTTLTREVLVGGTNAPLAESFESSVVPPSWIVVNSDEIGRAHV